MRPRRPKNSKARKAAVKAGYRSAFEAAIAKDLDDKGIKYTYEKTTIPYTRKLTSGVCNSCGGKQVGRRATYTPDFGLPGNVFVESKGYFPARDRAKLVAVRSQHPEIDLRLLFGADNWTTKLHKQRYSEWATKQGFRYAIGKRIPDDWIKASA
jgi:hypothetical protein